MYYDIVQVQVITITECQSIFDFSLPSVIISDMCKTFHIKYESCSDLLYKLALSLMLMHY